MHGAPVTFVHQIYPGEFAKIIKKADIIFIATNRARRWAQTSEKMSSNGDEE
jgi:hypothetical protein